MGGTASYNENVKIYSSLDQIETHARKKNTIMWNYKYYEERNKD